MINPPTIFKNKDEVPQGTRFIAARASALEELYALRNPTGDKGSEAYREARKKFIEESDLPSVYIYYPWAATAVETLPEEEYFELRTARNRHVITDEEQRAFRKGRVGIAGLSVGSAVLHTLALSGGPRYLKIADFDVVAITNLNRLRATLLDVEESKVEVSAKNVWEVDPYAEIEQFEQGITDENAERFMLEPRLDILIDEMEAIDQKIRMRLIAKRERIPVLMATDNGNGIILDVERFDLEPERPLFHGLIEAPNPDEMKKLSFREWLSLATKIVGPEFLGEKMRRSILEIGKTIPSVPQLGASALFAGTAMAYATRTILSGAPLASGRYTYTLEQLIDLEYDSEKERQERKASVEDFMRKLHEHK